MSQKLSRQVCTVNGIGEKTPDITSMPGPSRSSSSSGSSISRPTLMTHGETLKLLIDADESPVKSDFTSSEPAERQNGGKSLTM